MNVIYDLRMNKDEQLINHLKKYYTEDNKIIKLDETNFKACKGCWDCWLKSPGVCVIKDDMAESHCDYVNSDNVMVLMDTNLGFINHRAKAFLDRIIPHLHPYIKFKNGECGHKKRYAKYPNLVFYFNDETLSETEEDLIERYLARTAYHFKSKAYRFAPKKPQVLKEIKMSEPIRHQIPFNQTDKNKQWIIYMGSPRSKNSNSMRILDSVKAHLKDKVVIRDLSQKTMWDTWINQFPSEEHVLFFLPLYVHAMPSEVMRFMERLTPSKGNIAFFIQSGFPESSQSYYLEGIFEQISNHLQRTYIGTLIKGGIESIRFRTDESLKPLMTKISDAFIHLINEGYFNPGDVKRLATPEKFAGIGTVIMKMVFNTNLGNTFWDKQLKENAAYKRRNDRPYKKA